MILPLIPIPSEIVLHHTDAPPEGPVETTIDPQLAHLGPDGYTLVAHQEGYRLEAPTESGLVNARRTLDQLQAVPEIPCCSIEDYPAMRMRAIMLDLARCTERLDYYYEMIDLLAGWKINTVFLHLTDHSGCALQFKSKPDLATRHAFTQDEMRDLIRFAAGRNIELVPEIETWGHAKYITRIPDLAELAEDPNDPRALCTSNPRTWEFLANLIDEVAALFPSAYIHAGCDEAAFGKCPKCTAKAESEGVGALVGEHVRRVCELVSKRGKKPMVWGDVLLAHRDSIQHVPKDAVVTHWDYVADPSREPVEFLKTQGYEVVGCPAIVWGSRMILPMADTLDNVENSARIAADNACLGMETTIWYPQRYIPDTLCFSLAYAAEQSWSPGARDRLAFAKAFTVSFFGFDADDETAHALIDIHSLSEKAIAKLANPWEYCKQLLDTDRPAAIEELNERKAKARAIAAVLKSAREKVVQHLDEFDQMILAAEIASYLQDRSLALVELISAVSESDLSERIRRTTTAVEKLEEIARREATLRERMDAAWDRRRYPDDPLKREGKENLFASFERSRQFVETIIPRLRTTDIDLGSLFEEPAA